MPRLPSLDDLGQSPVPQSRRQIATNPAAGAVGSALEGVGQAAYGVGQQLFEANDKLDMAAAKAKLYQDALQKRQGLQQNDPDYETWGAKYNEAMTTSRTDAAGLIRNHGLRAQFDAEARDDVARQAIDLNGAVFTRRANAEVERTRSASDSLLNTTRGATDEKTRTDAINQVNNSYQALVQKGYIDETQAGAERRNWVERFRAGQADASKARAAIASGAAVQASDNLKESETQIATANAEIARAGHLGNLSDPEITALQQKHTSATRHDIAVSIAETGEDGPARAQAYIDQFKSQLTGDDFVSAQTHVTAILRSRQVEANRVAAVAKSQFNEDAATAEAEAANGKDVSGQLPTLIRTADALGDTSKAERLRGLLGDQQFAKVYDAMPPLARQQHTAELAGVKNPTPEQQQELHWLRDHSGALDAKFNGDSVGFVIEKGRPEEQPPPLVPGDPKSYNDRAQWQRTMAGAYGRMGLLSANEQHAYQQTYASGFQGEASVANELALFGGAQAREAARQIEPNDHYLQQLVILPEAYRKIAINGRDALKANPKLAGFADATGSDDDTLKAQITGFDLGVDNALRNMPQEDRNGIRQVAKNIAAKFLNDHGQTKLSPELWDMSVNMALGAVGAGKDRRGGLGKWNNMTFAVPDGFTEQEFANHVFDYVRHHPQNGPTNPDGSPASLRNARPVVVGKNSYQFFVGDNVVTARTGGPWQFTLGGRP